MFIDSPSLSPSKFCKFQRQFIQKPKTQKTEDIAKNRDFIPLPIWTQCRIQLEVQSFEEKKWPSANDNFQLGFQNPLTEANNMIATYIITEEKKKGK